MLFTLEGDTTILLFFNTLHQALWRIINYKLHLTWHDFLADSSYNYIIFLIVKH